MIELNAYYCRILNEWRVISEEWRGTCQNWKDDRKNRFEQEYWIEIEKIMLPYLRMLEDTSSLIERTYKQLNLLNDEDE